MRRWCCRDEREREKEEEEGKGKEGKNLLGRPKFKKLENGRFKCVEIGHEVPSHARDSNAQSKRCRIGLIDAALACNKPPLNTFHQDPLVRSELICTLTGNIVNKSEEHINGKRFLNMLEGNEQKKKRMKADSDISRPTPSVRNDLDALASLKGEQCNLLRWRNITFPSLTSTIFLRNLKYLMRSLVMMKRVAARECTSCLGHILYLSQSGMIPLVLEISLLGNKFWLYIRQQLHCIKQL
ncbi:unnamed protein product [Camellia sinensis]